MLPFDTEKGKINSEDKLPYAFFTTGQIKGGKQKQLDEKAQYYPVLHTKTHFCTSLCFWK